MVRRPDGRIARQVFVRQHALAIGLLGLVAFAYLVLAFVVMPGQTFFSGDEGLRFIQVQAYVRHHWQQASLDYPGREMDPTLQSFPLGTAVVVRGRLLPTISLPLPFLASLTYAWWGTAGLFLWPLLAGLGTILVTYVLGQLIEVRCPALLLLTLGFGTPLIFYSLTFWDHTLGVFFATLGICILAWAIKHERRRAFGTAGLVLAVAVWNRPELYEFLAATGLAYVLIFGWSPSTLQHGLYLGLGMVTGLVPLWTVNWRLYGNPLGLSAPGIVVLQQAQPHRALNQLYVATSFLTHGAPGRARSAALALSLVLLIIVLRVPAMHQPRLIVAAGLLCAAAYLPQMVFAQSYVLEGLLPTWPLLAFSFTYLDGDLRKVPRSTRLAPFVLLTTLLFVLLACLTSPVDGGLQWGPRYLLVAFPMLAVLAHRTLTRLSQLQISPGLQHAVWGVFLLLLVTGIGLQTLGLRQQYNRRETWFSARSAVLALPEEIIVTDSSWFVLEMADLYYHKEFHYVASQSSYQRLVDTLRTHNVARFAFIPLIPPAASPLQPVVRTATYHTRRLSGVRMEIVDGLGKN